MQTYTNTPASTHTDRPSQQQPDLEQHKCLYRDDEICNISDCGVWTLIPLSESIAVFRAASAGSEDEKSSSSAGSLSLNRDQGYLRYEKPNEFSEVEQIDVLVEMRTL